MTIQNRITSVDVDVAGLLRKADVMAQCALLLELCTLEGNILLSQILLLCDAVQIEEDARREAELTLQRSTAMIIAENQLQFCLQYNFKVQDIAVMFGFSKTTE